MLDGTNGRENGHCLEIVAHRARLDPGIAQHLVDEPEQVLLRALDTTQVFTLFGGDRSSNAEGEQVRVSGNRIERRSQLVGHDGQEFRLRTVGDFRVGPCTLGFRASHALRLIERAQRFTILLLRLAHGVF